MQIKLANPRGFCAGVDRAIEIVNRALVSPTNTVTACGLSPTISDRLRLPTSVKPAMSSGLK